MAGGKGGGGGIAAATTNMGRPIGPFFFWCLMFIAGVMFIDHGKSTILLGIPLAVVGAVFAAGTFWICVAGKRSYGNVNDLV